MCLGSIVRLTETWNEFGARVGRLDDGSVVSLAFLPDASAGAYVLVHVGIPVEVLDPKTAREALALRANEQPQEEVRR
jgi:hydrogenase expression/formation protein HypC